MPQCGEPYQVHPPIRYACRPGQGQRMQFGQLKRREFITLVGGAAAWPLGARAQQPAMPVVGYLDIYAPEPTGIFLAAFRNGLRPATSRVATWPSNTAMQTA